MKVDDLVALGAARALGKLEPILAVSRLLVRDKQHVEKCYYERDDWNSERSHEILSEICTFLKPDEILARYQSPEKTWELVQLSGCNGRGLGDAARRTLREMLGNELLPTLEHLLRKSDCDAVRQVINELIYDEMDRLTRPGQ